MQTDRHLLPAGRTVVNPQQRSVRANDATNGLTDARTLHRPCCACYASSVDSYEAAVPGGQTQLSAFLYGSAADDDDDTARLNLAGSPSTACKRFINIHFIPGSRVNCTNLIGQQLIRATS